MCNVQWKVNQCPIFYFSILFSFPSPSLSVSPPRELRHIPRTRPCLPTLRHRLLPHLRRSPQHHHHFRRRFCRPRPQSDWSGCEPWTWTGKKGLSRPLSRSVKRPFRQPRRRPAWRVERKRKRRRLWKGDEWLQKKNAWILSNYDKNEKNLACDCVRACTWQHAAARLTAQAFVLPNLDCEAKNIVQQESQVDFLTTLCQWCPPPLPHCNVKPKMCHFVCGKYPICCAVMISFIIIKAVSNEKLTTLLNCVRL